MPLPIDTNEKLQQIATGFGLAEGPAYSRRGYLLFTDIRNARIHKWEKGQLSVFRENSNRANGLTFDHQGRLLVAEGGGRVTRTEKNGSITVLAETSLQGPNDIVYAIDGSIYFTDLPKGRVYQITRQGQVRVVAETAGPNGLALSPNQQDLYVADYKVGGVKIHAIEPDGSLQAGKAFAPLTVDGLKTDEAGNVWMASVEGIEVYTVHGEPLGKIPTPERPTNCGFSGGTLYVTTPTSVYQIQTKTFGTRTF
ncbi:MAG: SMP-30/gluconolactonase/LRE family protein [Acidobacteria bacterium]|nr:SMP-30/gluconolactonase/LRE family protein [Acidobacteriota bacterium]